MVDGPELELGRRTDQLEPGRELVSELRILLPWLGLRSTEPVESMRSARWFGLVVRAGWLSIALLGISALLTDVSQITSS